MDVDKFRNCKSRGHIGGTVKHNRLDESMNHDQNKNMIMKELTESSCCHPSRTHISEAKTQLYSIMSYCQNEQPPAQAYKAVLHTKPTHGTHSHKPHTNAPSTHKPSQHFSLHSISAPQDLLISPSSPQNHTHSHTHTHTHTHSKQSSSNMQNIQLVHKQQTSNSNANELPHSSNSQNNTEAANLCASNARNSSAEEPPIAIYGKVKHSNVTGHYNAHVAHAQETYLQRVEKAHHFNTERERERERERDKEKGMHIFVLFYGVIDFMVLERMRSGRYANSKQLPAFHKIYNQSLKEKFHKSKLNTQQRFIFYDIEFIMF
jgi:hypothetical protein